MLHALRKICNHPSNLDLERWPELKVLATSPDDIEASGKTLVLHVLLEQVLGQGEKAVIFCQYLKTVSMLASQIAAKFGIIPQTLVGGLSREERAQRVLDFQH